MHGWFAGGFVGGLLQYGFCALVVFLRGLRWVWCGPVRAVVCVDYLLEFVGFLVTWWFPGLRFSGLMVCLNWCERCVWCWFGDAFGIAVDACIVGWGCVCLVWVNSDFLAFVLGG